MEHARALEPLLGHRIDIQRNNPRRIQFGVVPPHACHGAVVEVGVFSAAAAAMALALGAAGADHIGGETLRLSRAFLDQPFWVFGLAQVAQGIDQMALQGADAV